jgi:hypothetical protein
MKQIGGIITILIMSALLGACNSGGGVAYGQAESFLPIESTPPEPGHYWANVIGESSFVYHGASTDSDVVSYDPKNNWVFARSLGRGGYETNLNYESGALWQYGLDQALYSLHVDMRSNFGTDKFGHMYAFGQFSFESQPNINPLLVTFNTNTMEVQYSEIGTGYPVNTDFSNLFYYNGSVYALVINKQSDESYMYGFASFAADTGAYESTISNVYSSANQFLTISNLTDFELHAKPQVNAVLGDNGNLYVNDYGKVSEIPLDNPSVIRQIGSVATPRNALSSNMVPIAYFNGMVYVCGMPNNNPMVTAILSLPITALPGASWNQVGYTSKIYNLNNLNQVIGYQGCTSLAAGGGKLFATGAIYGTSAFPIGFVFESDIADFVSSQNNEK